MADLLETAARWLETKRRAHLSRAVVYCRGSESVTVLATKGRSEFEQTDAYGGVIRTESADYLIAAADLVLGGQVITPRAGDRIKDLIENGTCVFEVRATAGDTPFRYTDEYRLTLRIHTKFVGME